MARFGLKIEGLGALQAQLRGLGPEMKKQIGAELEAAAYEMHGIATELITSNGAIDQGFLKASLQVIRDRATGAVYFENTAFYAPMVEFGTKGRVSVPPEWANYAMQFKGIKNGTIAEFKSNIKDWIRRKGIPIPEGWTEDSLADRIVLNILVNGLKPRPFMYPAYSRVAANLPARIQAVIDDVLKP
jgi:hypothetical protein